MRTLTRLAVVMAVLGGVTLVAATGAFTAAEMDRPVSFSTVENEDGMVGLVGETIEVESGDSADLFVVKNRFVPDLDVTVTDVDDGDETLTIAVTDEPSALHRGADGEVVGTVTCTEQVTERDVTFSVAADGDGGTFEGSITVPVTCTPPESGPDTDDVTFIGCGNAEITGFEGTMDVTLVTYSTGAGVSEIDVSLEPGDRPGSPGGQLIGLETPFGSVYNPNYDFEQESCGNSKGHVSGEPGDPIERLDGNQ